MSPYFQWWRDTSILPSTLSCHWHLDVDAFSLGPDLLPCSQLFRLFEATVLSCFPSSICPEATKGDQIATLAVCAQSFLLPADKELPRTHAWGVAPYRTYFSSFLRLKHKPQKFIVAPNPYACLKINHKVPGRQNHVADMINLQWSRRSLGKIDSAF